MESEDQVPGLFLLFENQAGQFGPQPETCERHEPDARHGQGRAEFTLQSQLIALLALAS